MKLLASLLGCAAADYACCPYDDFGVVNPHCPLSEKTPWAMQNANADADPVGVSDHICKAWEANIDATMEGNEDGDNWGGCGFQRHFPWAISDAQDGDLAPVTPADLEHCRMGMFTCPIDQTAMTNHYQVMNTGVLFNLETGFFAAGGNDVFGTVTLGGICKLWIPVRLNAIDSVSIAGVHMNGGGTAGDPGFASVFDDTTICDSLDCGGVNKKAGTAFCFSVVNIAEFMENNMPGSSFRVMNANVAGKDIGGGNPITLDGNEYEEDFEVDFGDSIEPANPSAGGGTIVDAGASFDVVVHFKSEWCIRHWTLVDMQSAPDVGSNNVNYPLGDDAGGNPQHAHTDVADKRFDGKVGICGCCNGGVTHDADANIGVKAASSCTPCDDDTVCTEFNTYADAVPDGMQWPNAGAWAAFYSFVTCADASFMVYDSLNIAGAVASSAGRIVVHSMFYNDVRHDYSNAWNGSGKVAIRGNFRQVGTTIKNCGPGILDTTDNKRCTWNWNFFLNSGKDAEEWFSRTNPVNFAVWKTDGTVANRNTESESVAALIGSVIETLDFTATFQDDSDAGPPAATTNFMSIDAAKYFTDPSATIAAAGHAFTFTMHCREGQPDGNGAIISGGSHSDIGDLVNTNVRDLFPDCYMGDEVHFQYVIDGGSSATTSHRINAWFSSVTMS